MLADQSWLQNDRELGVWRRERFSTRVKMGLFVLAAIILCILGGAVLSLTEIVGAAQGREKHLARIISAITPAEIYAELFALEDDTNESPAARWTLAMAYAAAAERLPERAALWQRALVEITAATAPNSRRDTRARFFSSLKSASDFAAPENLHLQIFTAAVLLETGQEIAAAELLQSVAAQVELLAEDDPAIAASTYNSLAYLYATARTPEVYSPRRALEYALKVVPDWQVSDHAAYLDTLAMAYYANGDYALAQAIEQRAWGLAAAPDLWTYQENYARIAR